jgi:hypothetical protein
MIASTSFNMSALMETSLTSMKAAFPTASKLVQGIPMLQSLIELVLHMCQCAQTHKTPVSKDMNMLFCAAAPDLYAFFTKEAYPTTFFQFPKKLNKYQTSTTARMTTRVKCSSQHTLLPRKPEQTLSP